MKPLSKSTYVKAIDGKELPAVYVISEIFKNIKDHFLEMLSSKVSFEIQWVLSVPTIWNDRVRLFMKEAAKKVIVFFSCALVFWNRVTIERTFSSKTGHLD